MEENQERARKWKIIFWKPQRIMGWDNVSSLNCSPLSLSLTHTHTHTHTHARTHACTHTHTPWFSRLMGTLQHNGFYSVQTIFSIALQQPLNLPITGNFVHFYFIKKTNSVWFRSLLNYGDTEIVPINHLLLVISMSYPCYYTNLCPYL